MRTLKMIQGEPERGASAGAPTPAVGGWARVRRAAAELAPEAIEQIATRVAALLQGGDSRPIGDGSSCDLLDAAQLARRLGVTRTWVYEHANELGAITLGGGPRPRLRFDPELAARALGSRGGPAAEVPQAADRPGPGRPRRRPHAKVPLLPVHEPATRRLSSLSRSLFHRRSRG